MVQVSTKAALVLCCPHRAGAMLQLQMSVCWLAQISHSGACTQASRVGCIDAGTAFFNRLVLPLCELCCVLIVSCPPSAGDGWEQWQHRFDAPPVAAYASSTGRVNLLAAAQQQRAALAAAAGGTAHSYGALLPASWGSRTGTNSEAVMLVTLNNSLFGIPASHVTFEVPTSGDSMAAASEQCEVPLEERLAREQQQPDGVPGSALAVFQPQQPDKHMGGSQAGAAQQCKPADAETCAATTLLGVYAVQHGSSDLMLLPPAANSSAGEGQPGGGATGKFGFLVLLASAAIGGAASVAVVALVAWRRVAPTAAAQQQVQQQQEQQVQAAPAQEVPSSRARRRGSASGKRQQQQQQMSNPLKGLVQQAASDDAAEKQPASAEAARHPEGNVTPIPPQQDDSLPSSAAVAAGLMDPAMRRREMQDGVILIGRMRVRPCGCAKCCLPLLSLWLVCWSCCVCLEMRSALLSSFCACRSAQPCWATAAAAQWCSPASWMGGQWQ